MNNIKCFLILIATHLVVTVKCDIKAVVRNRVKKLEERNRRLYGDAQGRPIKLWELDAENPTSYPNGDKQKLAEISHAWITYYRCTMELVASVTSPGRLPGTNVAAYEGAVARLPCGLCVAPGESDRVAWFYSQSTHNISFKRLNDSSSAVSNVNLTIYNVQRSDAGLYRCRLGASVGGPVVLLVLHDDKYQVTRADSHHGPEPAIKAAATPDLVSYIRWSPWSACSDCGRLGARRRHGLCYVRLNASKVSVTGKLSNSIFQEFPSGIACRSGLLPAAGRDPTISDRDNIIMTESCEIPCEQVFEVRSQSGEVLERARNSDGVFSLCQSTPPPPPPPAREAVFVEYGHRLTLMCPGSTLRDIPITWRRSTKPLAVGSRDPQAAGRVHLNARDQIVFAFVEDGDADVYSCWQSTALAGVVKLAVWRDARLSHGRPAAAVGLAVVAVALRYAVKLLQSKLRHAP